MGLTRTMTYKGVMPGSVRLIHKLYKNGVRLTKKQMIPVESRLKRMGGLEKYFITIVPDIKMW